MALCTRREDTGFLAHGILLRFHFQFFSKIAKYSDQIFLILTWLCNKLLSIFCELCWNTKKKKQNHYQLLPRLQSYICHVFLIDATRAETRLLSLGTSLSVFVFCFEVEYFKCNGFVWTLERTDLINLRESLFLNPGHHRKVELFIR